MPTDGSHGTILVDLEEGQVVDVIGESSAGAAPTRAISPQVAAALLSKARPEFTTRQAEIVDQLKEQCPGYTAMRRLSMGFRCILCRGKVKSLHRWLEKARKARIHPLESFVRTVKQDLAAVEAAVTEKWSNGPGRGTSTA